MNRLHTRAREIAMPQLLRSGTVHGQVRRIGFILAHTDMARERRNGDFKRKGMGGKGGREEKGESIS